MKYLDRKGEERKEAADTTMLEQLSSQVQKVAKLIGQSKKAYTFLRRAFPP